MWHDMTWCPFLKRNLWFFLKEEIKCFETWILCFENQIKNQLNWIEISSTNQPINHPTIQPTNQPTNQQQSSEKTYKLCQHSACNVAGLTADANILIDQARLKAGRYQFQYCEPIPIEQLVEHVCNYKQAYTQYGGLRPFGVAFLFAGYDEHHGFQLYQSDPSGNYSGWKATVIGANNQAGKSLLKNEYGTVADKETTTTSIDTDEEGKDKEAAEMELPDVNQALRLAVKVLNKTMDVTATGPEKMELFVMTVEKGQCVHKILNEEEVNKVLKEVEAEAASAGDS